MNILLIQLKRIGDLILTVPAIAAARKHFPAARITLVVGHGSRELLPAIAGLDRTLIARGQLTDAPGWIALAAAKFDYCLDFSRTDRSAFLTLLSGAKKRVTYASIRRRPLRQLSYNDFVPSRVRNLHTIDHHLALLAPLGVHDASPLIPLNLPRKARLEAAVVIERDELGDDFVVIHSGSARAEKFWVARGWAAVADEITSSGRRVVLTGGRSRLEQQHIARIKAHLGHPVIDLSGRLDLLALAALIQRARLLLTIDSAPMHLAGALGTPQVILFGPTNPFHWRPRSTTALILQAGQHDPLRDFAPKQIQRQVKEISTQQVIDAMHSLLSRPAAPVA